MVKLLDEAVYLLQCGARTLGDAVLAALVEDFGVLALLRGHRLDNGFDTLEGVVVDVNVLESLAHAGNHGGEFLEVAHFLDLLNLAEEIVEVELVLLDFALQLLGFLLVVLGLCALHEADDIAHTKDAVGHSLGVEHVEGFHFLACADKFDGFVHHGANTQGCTAAGVAIEFCQDDAIVVQAVVEFLGGIHGVLSRHGINNKERFVGLASLLDGCNLAHQFLVNGQTTSGIDDNRVVSLGLGVLDAFAGDGHGVLALQIHVDGHVNLLCQHAKLLNGCGTIDVAGHEQGAAVFLRLEQECEFAREGGLTRTVETCHEDDGGMALELEFLCRTSHECGQLIVYNLHEQLSRLHGGEHVLSEGLLLDSIGEGLGYLIIDVGIKEGAAYVLERFGHVDFRDAAFAFQYFERAFKSFAEIFKHIFLLFSFFGRKDTTNF